MTGRALALAALIASPALWQCLVRHDLPLEVMLERAVVVALGCVLLTEVVRRWAPPATGPATGPVTGPATGPAGGAQDLPMDLPADLSRNRPTGSPTSPPTSPAGAGKSPSDPGGA